MIDICENKISGHHSLYFNSLLKLKYTNLKFIDIELCENKKNLFLYLYTRKKLLNEYLKSKKKIIHILTCDYIYILPLINKLYSEDKKIMCTIHHIPKGKIKKLLLKNFAKKINLLIVHSKYLKAQLNDIGIANVIVVDYPSFYDYNLLEKKENIREKYKIPEGKKVISILGGTRKDKGIDILLKSFNYMSTEEKENIILNIAGEEDFFSEKFIMKEISGINVKLELKKLTDDEFCENVLITDIMIMPYRKTFGGNSGPMTEAIINKIPCIAPKELNIGNIVFENNLGEVFECENPKDLSLKIIKTLKNINNYYSTDFYKFLSEEKFLESYSYIYDKLISDLCLN
ncbi:glycosyltransferase [Fusobacterium sp. PH5-44]|uniref:glycosyltransferase n=1 Tax=unclassified Fusobacterium TaxID=2648384 RepID=UPI003D20DCB9